MTTPTPEAIEVAAEAILRVTWENDGTPFLDEPGNVQSAMREFATAALTAAAPIIAAQAKAEALAPVLALHYAVPPSPSRQCISCAECAPGTNHPCPTVKAVEVTP